MASGFRPKCPGCGNKMSYLFDECYFCETCEISLDIDSEGILIPRDVKTKMWIKPMPRVEKVKFKKPNIGLSREDVEKLGLNPNDFNCDPVNYGLVEVEAYREETPNERSSFFPDRYGLLDIEFRALQHLQDKCQLLQVRKALKENKGDWSQWETILKVPWNKE